MKSMLFIKLFKSVTVMITKWVPIVVSELTKNSSVSNQTQTFWKLFFEAS